MPFSGEHSELQSWLESTFAIEASSLVRPPELGHDAEEAPTDARGLAALDVLDREAVARAYESPPTERCARLLGLGSRAGLPTSVVASAALDAGWTAERHGTDEDLRRAIDRARDLIAVLEEVSFQRDSLEVSASLLALRHQLPPTDGWKDALVRLPTGLAAGTLAILEEQTTLIAAPIQMLRRRVQRMAERRRRFEHAREFVASSETSPSPNSGPQSVGPYLAVPIRSESVTSLLIVSPEELAFLASARIGQVVEVADSSVGPQFPEQLAANEFLYVRAPDWPLEKSSSAEQMVLVGLLLSIALGAGLAWRSSRIEIRAARREAEFLTLVTHELKTPLTGIRVVAELLADGRVTDPEDHRRWLKRLDGEATRLGMLVENVLDLGRTERGETVHRPERIDLPELCREVCTMFEPIAAQHGMELHLQISEEAELTPKVLVDRDATKQALLNLCDNARKYGKDGRVIGVRVVRESDSIRCEVRDHGPGIAPEERESIFERFQRGRSHRSGQIPGAGLGLHLARGIVRRDGGNLRVIDPNEGPGALFQIDWPLRDQPTNPTA